MSELWDLFLLAAFVDNMPLTLFLGLCTFLALSKRPEAAFGLGVAMAAVLAVTVPLNHVINHGLLAPGAWGWLGLPDLDLSYLALIAFIGVIAAAVQLLEMVLDRFAPTIHASFGGLSSPADRAMRHPRWQPVHGRAQLYPGAIRRFRPWQRCELCRRRGDAGGHPRAPEPR